jgi:archaellum component FlaC
MKQYIDKRMEDMNRRMEDLKHYIDKRMEDTNKRIDEVSKKIDSLESRVNIVYNEVLSIKTDIIKMMKEYMEERYGKPKE